MFLVDGGTYSNVSIGDPIERCREEGYEDKDIIVDVLLCYEKPWIMNTWAPEELDFLNAWSYYNRREEISRFYFFTEEVQRLFRGYQDVNFRLVIQPSEELTSSGALPINAGLDELADEQRKGYRDGKNAVNALL